MVLRAHRPEAGRARRMCGRRTMTFRELGEGRKEKPRAYMSIILGVLELFSER